MHSKPLTQFRVVNIGLNLPGPLAARALADMGAVVTKVEPPGGDPLEHYDADWYAQLAANQSVERLDLKTREGRTRLDELLAGADLLLTSQRPDALRRLELSEQELRQRFPRLCVVRIVGEVGAGAHRPGHDLTYQAAHGLLHPPHMPRTLLADIAGAQQAVQLSLALLLARERGLGAGQVEAGLSDAAAPFAAPWRRGVTRPGAILGGGHPAYRLYRAADGWIAVGALEPHFQKRLGLALGVPDDDAAQLQAKFLTRNAAAWETWAREQDLPVTALPPDTE